MAGRQHCFFHFGRKQTTVARTSSARHVMSSSKEVATDGTSTHGSQALARRTCTIGRLLQTRLRLAFQKHTQTRSTI
jgi:hypothetical protein